MKFGMFLMLAGLVGALVVGPMYMKGPTGEPIMTADDWVPAALEQPMDLTAEPPKGFYSWVDEEGVTHFSDVRPNGIAEEEIETYDAGITMTLPSEAFTGPAAQADVDASLPAPLRVLLRSQSGGASSPSGGDAALQTGTESQVAMNGALAEIAQRFPQFKAMSDELARNASQPAAD